MKCGQGGCGGALDEDTRLCRRCGRMGGIVGRYDERISREERERQRAEGRLVPLPRVADTDPEAFVGHKVVPEEARVCGNPTCGEKVGRRIGRQTGREIGFCPYCKAPFQFTPALRPGDRLGGRYRVIGPRAHGGVGWVYLGTDEHLKPENNERYVAIKGVINPHDARRVRALTVERGELMGLDHPAIVRILAAYQKGEADPEHELVADDYIVMEYAGGASLEAVRRAQRPKITHLIQYALDILRPLGYLHERGLVYCDLKPENVTHSGTRVRLIDMGGVRHIGDLESECWHTPGYLPADEIKWRGVTVDMDLFSVARLLRMMATDRHEGTPRIPSGQDAEGVRSFVALLDRADNADFTKRFTSAAEMADQLAGVLRQILTLTGEPADTAPSLCFAPPAELFETGLGTVPPPGLWAGTDAEHLDQVLTISTAQPSRLDVGRCLPMPLQETRPSRIAPPLATAPVPAPTRPPEDDDPGAETEQDSAPFIPRLPPWRDAWRRGCDLLAARECNADDLATARHHFADVRAALPGESAPLLALAYLAELDEETRERREAKQGEQAAPEEPESQRLYEVVWCADHSYASAAFGLVRGHLRAGRRAEAVAVLGAVPETSRHYEAARVAMVRVLCGILPAPDGASGKPLLPTLEDLRKADQQWRRLRFNRGENDPDRRRMAALIVQAALCLLRGEPALAERERDCSLCDVPFAERALQEDLERLVTGMAEECTEPNERWLLIDLANRVRPRTWW